MNSSETKRCLYEILGIDREASVDDIKRAYKKMAFTHHPDRNPDNIEEATKMFHQLQDAYEILMDTNERAWYDQNRSAILRSKKTNTYMNIDSAEDLEFIDIFEYISSTCYDNNFDESEQTNFYSVYNKVFEQLTQEEMDFSKKGSLSKSLYGTEKYPEFGNSNSTTQSVNKFYTSWSKFTTQKSFTWINKYNPQDGPNRSIKRMIEKENEEMRVEEKKQFEINVKELVAFVKRRDPRMIKIEQDKRHQQEMKKKREQEKLQQEEELQKELHKLKMDDLKKKQEYLKQLEEEEGFDSEPDEMDDYEVDLMAYYQSKDVSQSDDETSDEQDQETNVEETQQNEDEHIDDTSEPTKEVKPQRTKKNKRRKNICEEDVLDTKEETIIKNEENHITSKSKKKVKKPKSIVTPSDEAEEEQVKNQIEPAHQDEEVASKKEKKRRRKEKKSGASNADELSCNVCGEVFPSKNKLFNHVKEKGHANAYKVSNVR
ncbi:DnaJ [Acrasis kona]|uniref:DnaJ n=1 Tax=Acrasis kona TaxID=1008807 RepID=A0AAW2ZKF1_9EUKA